VVMQCANCGYTLLREGARFCNNCGTPLPSDAAIAQVVAEVKGTATPPTSLATKTPPARQKPVLKEQIAQQPTPSSAIQHQPIITPYPTGLMSKSDANIQDAEEKTALVDKPVLTEVVDTPLPVFPEAAVIATDPGVADLPAEVPVDTLEDLPTMPMALEIAPGAEVEKQAIADQLTKPMEKTEAEKGTIADQLTKPMEIPTTPEPAQPTFPTPQRLVQKGTAVLQPYLTRWSTFYQGSILPRLPVALRSGRQPLLTVLTLILIPVLILGGLAILLVGTHPFGVAADTQPWLSFSDADLGLTLQYPNGWVQQTEHSKGSLRFYDSSEIGQVNIQVTNATSMTIAQYLQQQATTLALSHVKTTTPLSFAGTSWEQVQGSVVLNGANYSETLVATLHHNHTYMIAMLAPTSIYDREEQLIFSHMRATLHLL